eukprot:3939062-Amphidinium_carterae.1
MKIQQPRETCVLLFSLPLRNLKLCFGLVLSGGFILRRSVVLASLSLAPLSCVLETTGQFSEPPPQWHTGRNSKISCKHGLLRDLVFSYNNALA